MTDGYRAYTKHVNPVLGSFNLGHPPAAVKAAIRWPGENA